MEKCIVVGLTGQTGSGKTTVSRLFTENGFAVINCDEVAKNVTVGASSCCKALAKIFPECFDGALTLDRKALGKIVFNDSEKLRQLNETVFPFIIAEIEAEISSLKHSGEKYILLDAPTLFEAGADRMCDFIVSCVAEENTRLERIIKRDLITKELAVSRMSSQHSEEFFRENSDWVIENNGSAHCTAQITNEIILKIKGAVNG